jgi:hypothetical protein
MAVTAIRRVGRAQALEQLRRDSALAKANLSLLAKRWGVAPSTARNWLREARVQLDALEAAVAAPDAAPPASVTVSPVPGAPITAAAATGAAATNAVAAHTAAAANAPTTVSPVSSVTDAAPFVTSAAASLRGQGAGSAANAVAYATAAMLAGVAAYFSVSGMTEIFPGAPVAVVALAGAMEAAKLVTAGWLARHWGITRAPLRIVLIALVMGLAAINAAGVYGRLVEAHLGVTVATASAIDERIGAVTARMAAQSAAVAGLDRRLEEIDAAISKLTQKGRAAAALNAIANQRKAREALIADRSREGAALTALRSDLAKLDAERQRAEAAKGPIVYLAAMAGMPIEQAIRWLILLIVLTCDPTAIALTVAASRRTTPA